MNCINSNKMSIKCIEGSSVTYKKDDAFFVRIYSFIFKIIFLNVINAVD